MSDTYDIDTTKFPSFRDYLAETGQLERLTQRVEKRVIARQIAMQMEAQGVTKTELAARMGTSRAQLDRLLNPTSQNVTIDTIARAADALGQRFHMQLVKKAV
jgi:transcriptional regulator with XRE-family HTH domain